MVAALVVLSIRIQLKYPALLQLVRTKKNALLRQFDTGTMDYLHSTSLLAAQVVAAESSPQRTGSWIRAWFKPN